MVEENTFKNALLWVLWLEFQYFKFSALVMAVLKYVFPINPVYYAFFFYFGTLFNVMMQGLKKDDNFNTRRLHISKEKNALLSEYFHVHLNRNCSLFWKYVALKEVA